MLIFEPSAHDTRVADAHGPRSENKQAEAHVSSLSLHKISEEREAEGVGMQGVDKYGRASKVKVGIKNGTANAGVSFLAKGYCLVRF